MTTTENKSGQPDEKPVARIVTTTVPREKFVEIQYPVEFNGVTYDKIRIRRISGKELEEFFAAMDNGGAAVPPVVDCPVEVWDAMDADDQKTVDEAAVDFFPQKLKMLREAIMAASFRATSESMPASSQPPSTPPSTPSSDGNG